MIAPTIEFRGLSEAEVRTALREAGTDGRIANEVERLAFLYLYNFSIHVEHLGYIPADICRLKGRWPIEEFALRMAVARLREQYPLYKASGQIDSALQETAP